MTIIGVTGHQQLPPDQSWDWVRRELRDIVQAYLPDVTVLSSLAEGADQEFAQVGISCGGQLHAIVPCADYEQAFKSSDAVKRYKELLSHATSIETCSFPSPSEDAFSAAGERIVSQSDILVAVWNGKPAVGNGGTDDVVKMAQDREVKIIHINPELRTVQSL